MNKPYFNYDIAYDVYTKQIKKMAVGSIKRTGIKKIAKPVLLLAVIKGYRGWSFQTKPIRIRATCRDIRGCVQEIRRDSKTE